MKPNEILNSGSKKDRLAGKYSESFEEFFLMEHGNLIYPEMSEYSKDITILMKNTLWHGWEMRRKFDELGNGIQSEDAQTTNGSNKIQKRKPKKSGWYWANGHDCPVYFDAKDNNISNSKHECQRGFDEGCNGYLWIGPLTNPIANLPTEDVK